MRGTFPIKNASICLCVIVQLQAALGLAQTKPAASQPVEYPRASYFPDVALFTQDGVEVRFYTDLVKGRIVIINFMYTECKGICGQGTKNLVNLQNAMGDRLGREVFIYSISLDPEHDTPDVLKKYAEVNGAHWTFLTANSGRSSKNSEAITELQKSLGLTANLSPRLGAESKKLEANAKKHSGMMLIGNDALDKWDKASVLSRPDAILQMIERIKPPPSVHE